MRKNAVLRAILLAMLAGVLVGEVRSAPPALAAQSCHTSKANPCKVDCLPSATYVISSTVWNSETDATLTCPTAGGGQWTSPVCTDIRCTGTTPANVLAGKNNGECRRLGAFVPHATCWIAPEVPHRASCSFVAVEDPTDPQGRTWIELTASTFNGERDVVEFRVTCWLQTQADLGQGEIPNTRHTCEGNRPVGVCSNPVIFQIDPGANIYSCTHGAWTKAGYQDDDLVDNLLEGDTNGIVEEVFNANATFHQENVDADELTPGTQCELAFSI